MKYLIAPLTSLLLTPVRLYAPVLMLLALPFIKWDKEPTLDGSDLAIRGDLPGWLDWLSTPDERLPGGLYEPAHKALYERYGKWVASWYWLGIRNVMFGLSFKLGKPASAHFNDEPMGLVDYGDIWQYRARLGILKLVCGYKVYTLKTGLWAVPCFSIMSRPPK